MDAFPLPVRDTTRKAWRVTVDYGDDRIRTYLVYAPTAIAAEEVALEMAESLLTVYACDDVEEWPGQSYDAVLGEEGT